MIPFAYVFGHDDASQCRAGWWGTSTGAVSEDVGTARVELVKRVWPTSIASHAVAGSHLIVGTLFGATVSLHPLPGTRGDAVR